MPESLADRLRVAHHQRFVGRTDELALFERALDADEPPFAVLYVHGPGGIGKTALLQAMQYRCADRGVAVHPVDARHVEPTAESVRHAIEQAGLVLQGGNTAERSVLFIDTFEALAPLHRWVRETLIPQLPASCLIVLSGRTAPPTAWRSDLRLQPLLHVMTLRNLPRAQSRAYLDARAVPDRHVDPILDFAHGHPLALSLAADSALQSPETPFSPVDAPDLMGTLMQRFLEGVPSDAHRRAVEACALVRVLTEPLLARLVDADNAHALFQWLRGLSFIASGSEGLFPHDIVRTALVADLRWRDGDTFQTLQRRARTYFLGALDDATTEEHAAPDDSQRILTDYLFVYRHNPVVRPFFQRLRDEWSTQPPPVRDAARDDDGPALRAMVAEHEGEASATLFDYWWARQPDSTQVFRAPDGAPVGFVLPLTLEETTPADRERDPAVAAAWNHLDDEAPLRKGETATLFRFWMAADAYQDISPVQSLISAYRVRYYLTTPNLAYTFIPAADPDRWKLLFAYADLHQIDGADFTVGDTTHGLFGHDWRVMPPRAWLELLAERDLSMGMPPTGTDRGPQMLVLSRSDFDDAVKSAFKAYARPDALHGHPLLRARLIADTTGLDADVDVRIEALRDLLRTTAEQLQQDPKTAKYYRALHATHLDPQPTQERAAEHLDLPFSTYRRHLRRGIEHVADSLWRREIGDS